MWKIVGTILLFVFTINLIFIINIFGVGATQTKLCSLVAPRYQTKNNSVIFEISIDCESKTPNAKQFPVDENFLVGLTVYTKPNVEYPLNNSTDRVLVGAPEIVKALRGSMQSRSIFVAGAPKWIVLNDADSASYDFDAKVVRIEKLSKQILVRFQRDNQAIAGKQHLLFAAWSKSARKSCNKGSVYVRSGCKLYGYVIGSDAGVDPIAAYPGMEINQLSDGTSERWIVERFR
jgi:hypothetical protein